MPVAQLSRPTQQGSGIMPGGGRTALIATPAALSERVAALRFRVRSSGCTRSSGAATPLAGAASW